MNTDDLKDLLRDELPEGLDGREVLVRARRGRLMHRLAVLFVGLGVLLTAMTLVWSSGALTSLLPQPATGSPVTASPESTSPETTSTPSSTAPSTSASSSTPPASTSPSAPPSTSTPQTPQATRTSTAGQATATRTTTTSASGPGSVGATQNKVTSFCQVNASALPRMQSVSGLLAVGPGGAMRVGTDAESRTVVVDGRTIFTAPVGKAVTLAATDGRHVVFAMVTAGTEDPAAEVYRWDSRGGQAPVLVRRVNGAGVTVVNGRAIVTQSEPDAPGLYVDLATGGITEFTQGGRIDWTLLREDGRYAVAVVGAGGVELRGNLGLRPPGTLQDPSGSNGTSWAWSEQPSSGPFRVLSPAMDEPIALLDEKYSPNSVSMGRNYLVVGSFRGETSMKEYRLVDLRTGAVALLPQDEVGRDYWLTPDDQLVVTPFTNDPSDRGYIDLGQTTLTC